MTSTHCCTNFNVSIKPHQQHFQAKDRRLHWLNNSNYWLGAHTDVVVFFVCLFQWLSCNEARSSTPKRASLGGLAFNKNASRVGGFLRMLSGNAQLGGSPGEDSGGTGKMLLSLLPPQSNSRELELYCTTWFVLSQSCDHLLQHKLTCSRQSTNDGVSEYYTRCVWVSMCDHSLYFFISSHSRIACVPVVVTSSNREEGPNS